MKTILILAYATLLGIVATIAVYGPHPYQGTPWVPFVFPIVEAALVFGAYLLTQRRMARRLPASVANTPTRATTRRANLILFAVVALVSCCLIAWMLCSDHPVAFAFPWTLTVGALAGLSLAQEYWSARIAGKRDGPG